MPEVSHPFFARLFARLVPAMEAAGAAAHRERLLAAATGRVLEPRAGTAPSAPDAGHPFGGRARSARHRDLPK